MSTHTKEPEPRTQELHTIEAPVRALHTKSLGVAECFP